MLNANMLAGVHVCIRDVCKRESKIRICISPTLYRKFTTKSKIIVRKPVVEIGGDEMSKIVSDKIKKQLIIPYVNLERDYYDCSLENRMKTGNEVVEEAAAAILKFNVGIKCSTITPGEKSANLTLSTPNSVFEKLLTGSTQFRESIVCNNINKFVPKWTKPVIICRHTFGELGSSSSTAAAAEANHNGTKDCDDEGLAHELVYVESIKSYAESCFQTALERNFPMFFTSKYTRLQKLDAIFYDVFLELYENKYKRLFDRANLPYQHRLTDKMAQEAIDSSGGFMWAMKSYDCELLNDVIGRCVGSMGMMVHTLKSHNGRSILTQPAHGSIPKHYKRHLKGKETSTNPISSIFAWTRGLQHRARLDCNYHLLEFAELLEQCSLALIEEGHLTKDLALCMYGASVQETDFIKTNEFIDLVTRKLELNIHKVFPREKSKVKVEALV